MKPREMLSNNLAVLKARFPAVYDRIQEVGNRMPTDFFYDDSGESSVLMIQRGEHQFPAYGSHRVEILLERWFKSLNLTEESLYAITGIGDGSHVRHFLRESKSGTNFLIAEKDPALLRETFARFDCTDFLSNERCILGVGKLDDAYYRDIQGAALNGVNEVNCIVFSPLHAVDEGYYDRMRNELLRQYLVIRPLMEVNVRTATNIQENTLKNLPHMAHAPDVGELKNQFQNIPFILIGAGPSLDESIDFLKSIQDKAIIVASNSPYRKLINSGIRPHLVTTADPMSPTLLGFNNVSLEGVPLACPFSAYPEIVERFSGRILSWCTFNPIASLLKNRTACKPGTPILEQGTVSGCVLDLSRLFGCKKVLFVGQDMAVRDDGRYYTDDSFYTDYGSDYAATTKGHRLPGNTQSKVLVEGRLFVYLKTFEQFIASNPSVEYRNLARTGVKIRGAPYMNYDEAEKWIEGEGSSEEFRVKVEQLLSEQGQCPDLQWVFSGVRNYVEKLFEKVLSLAIDTEMLPSKFSGTNYEDSRQIKDLLKKAQEVNAMVDSNKSFWEVLFDGRTKAELVNYRRVVRDIDFPSKSWSAIQRNKEYFWALSEGCNWFLELMNSTLPQRKQTSNTPGETVTQTNPN